MSTESMVLYILSADGRSFMAHETERKEKS